MMGVGSKLLLQAMLLGAAAFRVPQREPERVPREEGPATVVSPTHPY